MSTETDVRKALQRNEKGRDLLERVYYRLAKSKNPDLPALKVVRQATDEVERVITVLEKWAWELAADRMDEDMVVPTWEIWKDEPDVESLEMQLEYHYGEEI